MQRSVRENIALPFSARPRAWGPIDRRREGAAVGAAIERLQIDTRAQREVQRLSGGNQQKVTIARWIAADARTILCLDPTRGIDVRTKQEIYRLLRDLAAQGKSVLFYTSELEEVPLVCDRVVVIFGGRVVDAFPAALADEATLTRAAYGLPRLAGGGAMIRRLRREGWVAGLIALFLGLLLVATRLIQPGYGGGDFGSLARAVLPYAFAIAAQTVVVIAGGIDLSVASMMALTSVTAARAMDGRQRRDRRPRRRPRAADGPRARRAERPADRRHPGPRHRGDAGDALRLPGRGAPRARRRPAAPPPTG